MRQGIAVVVFALMMACGRGPNEPEQVAFSDLRADLYAGRIESITIREGHYAYVRSVAGQRSLRECDGPRDANAINSEHLARDVRVTYLRDE